MNSDTSKIQRLQQKEEQTAETAQSHQATEERTFETPEDLLRTDAENVSPPPAVFTRLQKSVTEQPPRSWWKRLLDKVCGT